MFVGHYAASFALKKVEKGASLGTLFLAVQFVDILFFPFVLAGIERMNIVENYTESTHFELVYMPYTHSLVAAIFWSVAAYAVFRWLIVRKKTVALVVALAVFSHWVLDLIVHTPDLPLLGDGSPKLGFGLWNNAVLTYGLEALLLVAALVYYLRSTPSISSRRKLGMYSFIALLLMVNYVNIFGPAPADNVTALALQVLAMYFIFAGLAYWLDASGTQCEQSG